MNYLIDASIYIFQYYFSLPDRWFSDEGWPTAAVYGYTTFLLRFLAGEVQPQPACRVALCFDESLGSCFRNEIYTDYKSSRALPDEALAFQLQACREVSELLGVACFSSDCHEADDFIGSLAAKLRRTRAPIGILSRDKDLGQLLQRPQDYLWDYGNNQRLYSGDIVEKFGVQPRQLVDYLALVGDSIDDIPGVPGVGPVTARVLLQHFANTERLLEALAAKGPDALSGLSLRGGQSLALKLIEHRQQIRIARQLAQIVENLPLDVKTSDLRWRRSNVRSDDLSDFCGRMGFSRLNTRIENLFG